MPVSKRPDRRTTMPLTGTVHHGQLRLSFDALVATRLALLRIARVHRMRPTLSAITRRALITYVRKLEAMTSDELTREGQRVYESSKALTRTDAEAIDRTLAGLEVSGAADLLPSLEGVLCGPSGPVDAEALTAKVDAMLKAAYPRRFKHL